MVLRGLNWHILDPLIFGECSEIWSLYVLVKENTMKRMSQGGGGGGQPATLIVYNVLANVGHSRIVGWMLAHRPLRWPSLRLFASEIVGSFLLATAIYHVINEF